MSAEAPHPSLPSAADVAFAQRLADAAGAAIRPHFRRLAGLDLKDDDSPVTVADRAAETAMRGLISEERPDDGVLGEEFDPVAAAGDRLWVLDPIDGTRAFVAGKPTFTTLVALVIAGRPVLGIIDQPFIGERWVGQDGGTTLNGEPITTRRGRGLAAAVISATAPEQFETAADRAAFGRVQRAAASLSWGGDGYAYGLVAAGALDVVVETGLKTFDYCAVAPVVAGAGGIVTDWTGQPLDLDSDGRIVAAGDAALHAQVLNELAG
ncbi:MAG: histidinol-phosphatase [Pseudomonadota bacterium]